MKHVGDNLLIFSSWKGFSRARLPPNVKEISLTFCVFLVCVMYECFPVIVVSVYCFFV